MTNAQLIAAHAATEDMVADSAVIGCVSSGLLDSFRALQADMDRRGLLELEYQKSWDELEAREVAVDPLALVA